MKRTTNFDTRLPEPLIRSAVAAALSEDLGLVGDITTDAVIGPEALASGVFAARAPGIIAGLEVAAATFNHLDPSIKFDVVIGDSERVEPGAVIARVEGSARSILSAERVALNFLGRLSGIATLTRRYVDAVDGTRAHIVDTRKTTPGLRALEKYAVRAGGGMNHRIGLFDAVLIKDNHIAVAGGIEPAIAAARARVGHMVKIEIEVDTLDQLAEALRHEIDAVLLDNMNPEQLAQAVRMAAGKVIMEASGGVNLATVRAIAESGVDLISVGALTHSASVLDIGLDIEIGTKT